MTPYYHLRKKIKAVLPRDFGSMKALEPSIGFNDNGHIIFRWGNFEDMVEKLKVAVGESYEVIAKKQQRSIVIQKLN